MAAVGRIARAHGIRGQVIVNLDTDFPEERFRPGAELFIERNGTVQALTLTSVRFQRDRPVVGIAGVETMNDARGAGGPRTAGAGRSAGARCRTARFTGTT